MPENKPNRFWKWLDFMIDQALVAGPWRRHDADSVRFMGWIALLTLGVGGLLALVLYCVGGSVGAR